MKQKDSRKLGREEGVPILFFLKEMCLNVLFKHLLAFSAPLCFYGFFGYCFVFMYCIYFFGHAPALKDLSSLTVDGALSPCIGSMGLNHWTMIPGFNF